MRVSIVIPVRNDVRVAELVRSLKTQLPQDAEILVADDGSPAALPALRGARVLPIHSGNQANARNHAARFASGEVLLFIDSDVVVPTGWIEKAQSLFADPRVLAAQGYSEAVGDDPVARRMQ